MAAPWESIDAYLKAQGIRVGPPTTGQTTGGGHADGSLHFQGRARDYGVVDSDAAAVARALVPLATGSGYVVEELYFSPLGIFYDNGQAFNPSASLRAQHFNHTHVGLKAGANLGVVNSPTPGGSTGGSSGGGSGIAGALKTIMAAETGMRIAKILIGFVLLGTAFKGLIV